MLSRAVVCVATTPHYQKGMQRLAVVQTNSGKLMHSATGMWPSHSEKPYAFKAYALERARREGVDLLLWCDSSILPIRSLEPLWERIEHEGYWISRNGWNNYQWTADSAYKDLFGSHWTDHLREGAKYSDWLSEIRLVNREIPHVVATAFGLNVKSEKGAAFLDEYFRLASETKAFCGPWMNSNYGDTNPRMGDPPRMMPCGPDDVMGHRHDQTAASVIAWRLGMTLTNPPNIFAYSKRRDDGTLHISDQDQSTILLADGKMEDGVIHD